jgi:hypothetical protein
MKTLVNRLTMFAAATLALGTMAYGQTVKAEIPFAFRTANATLPAGTYMLYRANAAWEPTRLWNPASRKSVLMLGAAVDYVPNAQPRLVFACGSEGCALREVRTSERTVTYPVPHRSAWKQEAVAVISVPLTRNAD